MASFSRDRSLEGARAGSPRNSPLRALGLLLAASASVLLLLGPTPAAAADSRVLTDADRDLFEAIAADDIVGVEAAIAAGADINEASNSHGASPLMAACERGNLDVVRRLVAGGADINRRVSVGLTYSNALARSIGSMKVLSYLVDQGALIGGYGGVEPLLLEVARTANITAARYLLIKGAKVNETNAAGWSPLMSAVTGGSEGRGNIEMVKLLVEWDADIDHRDAGGSSVLMRVTEPLIAAYLLEKGADASAADPRGDTPLSRILDANSLKEQEIVAVARLLLERGAGTETINAEKRTPLMIVVWRNYLAAAGLLLDKGAAVDARDPMGVTALSIAAETHQAGMIKLLIGRGADVNVRDRFGVTPLMHLFNGLPCDALSGSTRQMVDIFLSAGADLEAMDSNNEKLADILDGRGCAAEVTGYLRERARPPAPASAAEARQPAAPVLAGETSPAAVPPPATAAGATAGTPPRPLAGEEEAPPPTAAPPDKARLARLSRRVDRLGFNDRRFYLAMSRRDYPGMEEALAQGVDVNLRSESLPDGTFLLNAVKSRDLKLTAFLLTKGADANLRDVTGNSPLASAVGSKTIIKLLFRKGADLNALSPGEEADETPLAKAVKAGDAESVKLLLSLGADVNRRDATGSPPVMPALFLPDLAVAQMLVDGGADVNAEVPGDWTTPLMNAVVANSRPVVQFLVGAGADVNAKSVRGYTPLLLAVELADRSIVSLLLAKGADINLSGYGGTTPLLEAVMLNRGLRIVEFLLARGAAVNAVDDNGVSPLGLAVIRGRADVVKLLLMRGADVRLADRQGKTPLAYARERGQGAAEAMLLEAGAAAAAPGGGAPENLRPERLLVRAVRANDAAGVVKLLDAGVRVTVKDEESRRPLMALAVEAGHREMVDLLAERGADINDAGGMSTLHVAVKAGNVDMVGHLLAKGARVNGLAEDGGSPLHAAVRLASIAELGAAADPGKRAKADLYRAVSAKLIEAGADANAGTLQTVDLGEDSLWNPLHLAAYLGSPAMAELLLNGGAQVDARTSGGNTPLHLAVLTLSGEAVVEVVELLLARGGNPNDRNAKRNTVLHEALTWWDSWPGWGSLTVDGVTRPRWLVLVEKLLDSHAILNEPGDYGFYPLHAAAESGLTELAGLLLDRGASINVTDRDGNTPLNLAVRQNRKDMVDLLLRRGAARNPVNREDRTPLDEARYQKRLGADGAEAIEELLLKAGAEPGSGQN